MNFIGGCVLACRKFVNKAEGQVEALFLQKDWALKALQPANFQCVFEWNNSIAANFLWTNHSMGRLINHR